MRKLFFPIATMFLSLAWTFAQDSSQGASPSSPQNSNASETTIEGCLSGSAGDYSLIDNSGKSYKLQGNTSQLSDQVGHQVRIKGTEGGASARATTPSGATASANTGSSGSNPSASTETRPSGNPSNSSASASASIQFDVGTVEKISDSCTTAPTSK